MSSDKDRYEILYNITLSGMYKYVNDIMTEFSYSLNRTVKDTDNRRRIEVWSNSNDDTIRSLVWVEVVKPGEELDPYLTTDVLRAMNDENVTRLFFFTNSTLDPNDEDTLSGNNHEIFTAEDIINKIKNLEIKRAVKLVKKRKAVRIPSGTVLIKNYFAKTDIKKKQIKLRVSAISVLINQYLSLIRRILDEVDKVVDINNIPLDSRNKLKKIQYDLLPELAKTSSFVFSGQFRGTRDLLFNLVQVTIVYLGNFVEYEPEDDLKRNRIYIEEIFKSLSEVKNRLSINKEELIMRSENNALMIILTAGVITFISIVLLIVVKYVK